MSLAVLANSNENSMVLYQRQAVTLVDDHRQKMQGKLAYHMRVL